MDKTAQRILIVDDKPTVQDMCKYILAPLGYAVESAGDGTEAILWLEKQPFDLVITDFQMPGEINGVALGHIIKKRYPGTRIILMTAFPTVDTAVDILRTGGSDYLIKPFDQDTLINCVQNCLQAQIL
jgi:two-component system NtrC family response regulator